MSSEKRRNVNPILWCYSSQLRDKFTGDQVLAGPHASPAVRADSSCLEWGSNPQPQKQFWELNEHKCLESFWGLIMVNNCVSSPCCGLVMWALNLYRNVLHQKISLSLNRIYSSHEKQRHTVLEEGKENEKEVNVKCKDFGVGKVYNNDIYVYLINNNIMIW